MVNTYNIPKAGPEEQKILDHIEQLTGLKFLRLGGIDTRQQPLATVVLPVLKDWVENISDGNLRGAIYLLFATRHARPWIEQIIKWWTSEEDPTNLSILTSAVTAVVDRAHARRVWELANTLPQRQGHYFLLAALSRFENVAAEVKAYIKANLSNLNPGEVDAISKIKDESVKAWCREQKLAYLGLSGSRSDNGACCFTLELSRRLPDRAREVNSVETELRLVEKELADLFRDLKLPPPPVNGLALKLADLNLDRWFRLKLGKSADEIPEIWLRLEDVDTVEIVLMKSQNCE